MSTKANSSSSWLLPREHGAWGIVLVPYLTAVAVAGRLSAAVLVGLAAVLFAFIARYPLELLLVPGFYRRAGSPPRKRAKKFAWGYALTATGLGLWLVWGWELHWLLPLGALAGFVFLFHLRLGKDGEDRSWTAELLGTAGLTLSGLAGWIIATGGLDQTGLVVWLLNCTYFCAGIVYVKSRIRSRVAVHRPELVRTTRLMVGVHLGAVVFVALLVFLRWISPLILLPFVVAAARAGWGASRGPQPFVLRRLGWSEVGLSVFFAVFLTLGFRL
jgi:hypothetical protein